MYYIWLLEIFTLAKMSEEISWQMIIDHEDYEICTIYPHQIRRIDNKFIVAESVDYTGYVGATMNRKRYLKHILIAKQFVTNPDPEKFKVVDHINHNKLDNRIENLRWTSQRRNTNNRSGQQTVTDIPEDAIRVESYNGWTFEDLYFHDDVFYVYNGISYTVRSKFQRSGNWYSKTTDSTGINRAICYSKFKREYGLI